MDKVTVVNYCLGLLGLLLLQGVLNVQGRSIFNPGNNGFNPNDDIDPQSKTLALLLHKSLVPVEKNDPAGLDLANKLAKLEELQMLGRDLELEREIMAITRKRAERELKRLLLEVLCLKRMQEEKGHCEFLLKKPNIALRLKAPAL